jgi:ABC-type ATPase with predicted acetyltransferase domain
LTIPLFLRRRQTSLRKYVNEKLFPDSELKTLFKNKDKQEKKSLLKKSMI